MTLLTLLSLPAWGAVRLFTGLEGGYSAVLGDWYEQYKGGPLAVAKIGVQADRYTLTEVSVYYSPHDGKQEGTYINFLNLGLGARFRVAPLNPLDPYVYIGAAASNADEVYPVKPPGSDEYEKVNEWTTDWMVGFGSEVKLFRKTTLNYGPVLHFTRVYFPKADAPNSRSEGYMALDVKVGINYYF